jgi:hypothetical protein
MFLQNDDVVTEIGDHTEGSLKMEHGFIPHTITIYYFLA